MRFHHAIQHNIWNFSSDLSLKIEKLSHKFKNVFTDLIFLRAKKKIPLGKFFDDDNIVELAADNTACESFLLQMVKYYSFKF